MRTQRSLFPWICPLAFAACVSNAPEDSPPDAQPRTEATDGGSLGSATREAAAPGGGGDAEMTQVGAGDAQSSAPEAGFALGDASPDAASSLQDDAGRASACPSKYTTALHVRVEMSWPDTVGYLGGKGWLQTWTKVTFTRSASGISTESVPCGVGLPAVTSSPLLGGAKFLNEMPVSGFDRPTMPRFAGRAEWQGGAFMLDLGASVIGASLSEPLGAWPFRQQIILADHDGDGTPAMTSVPRRDPPFALPPADIAQTKYLDAVYTASRTVFRLSAQREGCDASVEGRVDPTAFDYTIVGCHIVNAAACGDGELNLLNTHSPVFTLGAGGQWRSIPSAESASCADVRGALPAD